MAGLQSFGSRCLKLSSFSSFLVELEAQIVDCIFCAGFQAWLLQKMENHLESLSRFSISGSTMYSPVPPGSHSQSKYPLISCFKKPEIF